MALLIKVYAQYPCSSEITAKDVSDFLNGDRATQSHNFSVDAAAMDFIFNDSWYRSQVKFFSGNLVTMRQRGLIYKATVINLSITNTLDRAAMMQEVFKVEAEILGGNPTVKEEENKGHHDSSG